MFGNLLFGLTALTYIALTIFNLQKFTATGQQLIGRGMMAYALIAAYIVCSLILTISIATKGGDIGGSNVSATVLGNQRTLIDFQ